MKRLIILVIVISMGAFGIYGFLNFTGENDFLAKYEVTPLAQVKEVSKNVAEKLILAKKPLEIIFSHKDTFYNKRISVELKSDDPKASIYYTLDSTTPTEKSKKYTAPIEINSRSEVTATTIKVLAIGEKKKSDIVTKSYVTGTGVFERFDPSTLVFVLSTDPYNLYDYYYGVAIEGFLRDEYINSSDYNGGNIEPYHPANYNIKGRDSERDMYVEVYDSKGKKLINQAAGAKVVGAYSRAVGQKSWRLIARNSYSEGNGMFKFSFFNNATNSVGEPILKYDRITLRNNANDREFGAMRDELSQELAKQAGFPDTQDARPAAVFLNGKYYGFAWLKEAYCEGYLEQTYGGIKENYQIVENIENATSGEEFAVKDYQKMYNLARLAATSGKAEKSFTNDNIFNEFCKLVDIDNLMLYYAIQTYIDNKDWPGNNFKAWRYYKGKDEKITNTYNDGKWRFLMFDVEFSWSLYGNNNNLYNDNTIKNLLSGNHMQGQSVFMKALFQRDDMREKFANTLCDLMGGSFQKDNVLKVIDQIYIDYNKECMYALKNGYTSSWSNQGVFDENRNMLRDFARYRPNVIRNSIKSVFELPKNVKQYKVELFNASGAEVWLNSQHLTSGGSSVSGEYFDCYNVDIKARPYSGYEFEAWEVNGIKYTDKDMKLNASMADEKNEISVVLRLKKLYSSQPLYISELYAAENADWVELYNPNDVVVTTKAYYLSDKEDELNRWKIPTVNIQPKSTLIITMKNNKSTDALKKLQTNFNLKEGETLYLSDLNGKIISSVLIVEMDKGKSMSRSPDGKYKITNVSPGKFTE